MENQALKALLDQITSFFLSAFSFPGLGWKLILVAIALGLVFGLLWLLAYWPPIRKNKILLFVGVISPFLTWAAIAFVQIPLQTWSSQALFHFWDAATLSKWLLFAGIPGILLSGIVQEGAKLVPLVFYWIGTNHKLDARTGLIGGAIAGAGFGIFEAVWVHNTIFAAGWTWQSVQTGGLFALAGFWERFFAVGFHIAVSALAGYGLAKGLGWQFYLVASFLHGALNYAVILLQKGVLSVTGVEIYIAAFTVALTAVVLWIRWKKTSDSPEDDAIAETHAE
jgi:RsiW-degrading membrane proteinase PrsW (M82 family)